MTTTHAAMGLLAGVAVAVIDPGYGAVVGLTAYAGGVFPDLDVFVGDHRRTLHYPVGYWGVGAPAIVAAVGWPAPVTVGIAAFLGGAALHSTTDILGGGRGPKPWSEDDDRGVYDHYRGRWLRPRRLVRWDGSPEDLILAVVLSVPPLVYFDGVVRVVTVAGIVASMVYAGLRRRLPDLVPALFT